MYLYIIQFPLASVWMFCVAQTPKRYGQNTAWAIGLSEWCNILVNTTLTLCHDSSGQCHANPFDVTVGLSREPF